MNEETIEQVVTRMQGVDLNEFVRLIEDEINKRAFIKALEFTKPDNGKDIYIAMDWDGLVFGCEKEPKIQDDGRYYGGCPIFDRDMKTLGIDVDSLPLTHEKPVKIRVSWEVVE